MTICRSIGWFILFIALAALAFEAFDWIYAGAYSPIAVGEIWFRLDSSSLNGFQAAVQRYISPWLWESVITEILLLPGWVVAGVPAILMIGLCRARDRRRFR